MNRPFQAVSYLLVGMLCLTGPKAFSDDKVVSSAEMSQAVSKAQGQEASSRAAITTLLERTEVKALAEGYGLDLRRAESAVGTLQGDELQRVAAMASSADSQLVGGAQTITISLVALLLIIIIVILVR